MIDNFNRILPILEYVDGNSFYFLQILQRKKENPELGNNSVVHKHYYIYNNDYLLKKKDEIIGLCKMFNARASINLNVRNAEKISFLLMQKISNQMMNKDFINTKDASVCGVYTSEFDKRWIIDIDEKNYNLVNEIAIEIGRLQTEINDERSMKYRILDVLETPNGWHIITNPFRVDEFQKKFKYDIHKNNPTVLYAP